MRAGHISSMKPDGSSLYVCNTHVEAGVEQNVPESLCLAQDSINQDDHWVVFYVLVHWLLTRILED